MLEVKILENVSIYGLSDYLAERRLFEELKKENIYEDTFESYSLFNNNLKDYKETLEKYSEYFLSAISYFTRMTT
jgi:hypothetical protein